MKLPFILCSALFAFGTLSIAGASFAQNSPAQPGANYSMPPFADVPDGHWALDSVTKLRQAGIVIGYPEDNYAEPIVPPHNWEYQAVDTMQKAGILFRYPEGTYSGQIGMTPHEFAIGLAPIFTTINLRPANGSDLAAIQQDQIGRLEENQPARNALKSLLIEFRPELSQLGQDVPKAVAWLDEIKPPAGELK